MPPALSGQYVCMMQCVLCSYDCSRSWMVIVFNNNKGILSNVSNSRQCNEQGVMVSHVIAMWFNCLFSFQFSVIIILLLSLQCCKQWKTLLCNVFKSHCLQRVILKALFTNSGGLWLVYLPCPATEHMGDCLMKFVSLKWFL